MKWLTPTRGGLLARREDPFSKLFDSFLGDWPVYGNAGTNGDETAFNPAIDVEETPDGYVVTAELPGVDPEKVNISTAGNMLSIEGTIEETTEKEENKMHIRERRYGKFSRSLLLPESVDTDNISAKFQNGLLRMTLPRRPETQRKQIKIES